jgi:hypothetical protein
MNQDYVCFECSCVLFSDAELNNHILKYHKVIIK